MPTLTLTNLAPGRTATIQRYTRGTATTVGAPIALANTGYTYSVDWPYVADYDCVLSGFTDPVGSSFPVREGIAYPGIPWSIIDNTIVAVPVIPTPITGLCNVLFSVTNNGAYVVGATVSATLEGTHNTTDGFLVARSVTSGTTDASGNCILTLIQGGQFVVGGQYRIVVSSANVLHVNRLVTIPSTSTANAEDLVSV